MTTVDELRCYADIRTDEILRIVEQALTRSPPCANR